MSRLEALTLAGLITDHTNMRSEGLLTRNTGSEEWTRSNHTYPLWLWSSAEYRKKNPKDGLHEVALPRTPKRLSNFGRSDRLALDESRGMKRQRPRYSGRLSPPVKIISNLWFKDIKKNKHSINYTDSKWTYWTSRLYT